MSSAPATNLHVNGCKAPVGKMCAPDKQELEACRTRGRCKTLGGGPRHHLGHHERRPHELSRIHVPTRSGACYDGIVHARTTCLGACLYCPGADTHSRLLHRVSCSYSCGFINTPILRVRHIL